MAYAYFCLSGYGTLLTILTVIAAALALICIFVITMNERKSEFGILISIGARPRQLSAIVYFEALIIGVVGAIAGVLASLGLIAAFSDILSVYNCWYDEADLGNCGD